MREVPIPQFPQQFMFPHQSTQHALPRRFAGLIVLAAALALSLLARGASASDWDELRARVQQQYQFRLHWNNVAGPPYWVGGVPIENGLLHRFATVTLAPGKSVELLVPADSFVRAYQPDEVITPDDLEFWVSDGSGLQVRHVAFSSPDGQSLVALPDHPETALVRITRPETRAGPLMVALFISYRDSAGDAVSYRTLASTPNPTIALQRKGDNTGRRFQPIDPAHPVSVRVAGPTRLKLETYLRYPPQEAESLQSYQLRLFSSGKLLKIADFETSVDTREQVLIEKVPVTLGRRQTGYVEIPAGTHNLTIDATAALFLRVLERDRREWLLPRNRPPLSTEGAQSWGYLFEDRVSHWDLTPADFAAAGVGAESTDGMPLLAFRSARDNSRPQGAVRAYFLLRALAAFRTDDDMRNVAEQLRARHTFFRDLMPVRPGQHARQESGYFTSMHLRPPGDTDRDVLLLEQHVDRFAGALSSGQFTRLPNTPQRASIYRLPKGLGSTVLQVVVDRRSVPGSAPLFVQFDDRTPIAMAAVAGPELPPSQYASGAVDAGLTAFEARHGRHAAVGLGGPNAQRGRAAPLIPAAKTELVVPAGVREIRVWSPTPQADAVSVALRYLDSKTFRLTEMEYSDAARRAGAAQAGPKLFAAALQRRGWVSRDQYAERELRNHWSPLVTWLRQEDALFRRGVVPTAVNETGPGFPGVATTALRARSEANLLATARNYADQEQWVSALEAWSRALPVATGAARKEAVFGRMTALRNLGEDSLYETGLRGLFLFDADESIRAEAASRLERMYRQTEDDDALLRLQAVRTVARPSVANLAELAQRLADAGRGDDVLDLSLILPRSDQSARLVLRSTLENRWWRHFDGALAGLSDLQEQHFWRAWRSLSAGDVAAAAGHLQQAGRRGHNLLARLQTGDAIQTQFRSSDPAIRAQAVFDWERWSETSTAPRSWSSAESNVVDYESTALVVSPTRGTSSQSYLGRKRRPVTLEVQGPVRLRIEARPLHPHDSSQPIEDWMIVETDLQRLQVPINNNHAADTVEFADRAEFRPGSRVSEELELGPGRHVVRVFGESIPLAVRAERLRPERELPVLPPIEPATVTAALTGTFGADLYDSRGMQFARIATPGHPAGRRVAIRRRVPIEEAPALNLSALPLEIAHRISLRLDDETLGVGRTNAALMPSLAAIPKQCSAWERYALLSRMGLPADDALGKLDPRVREEILWREGRGSAAVSVPVDPADAIAVRRRMASYVWLFEHDNARRVAWLARGEHYFETHANVPDLRGMHTRLGAHSEWSQTSQIERSAGLRSVPTDGWQPELPFLRVRKALLEMEDTDEQVITGDQQVVLRLDNERSTRLKFIVQLSEPPYVPPSPLTVGWQLDSETEHRQLLAPDRNRTTIAVDVPAGVHTVRLRCVEPWVNQFLRVRIVESNGERDAPLQRNLERLWNVATRDEPVVVPVEGPALVRIDELRDGTTTNQVRLIPEGLHRIELTPTSGRSEGLYRVFQLRYVADQPPPRIKHLEFPSETPPEPFLALSKTPGPALSDLPGDRVVPGTLSILGEPQQDSNETELVPGTGLRWLTVDQGDDFLMEANGVWSASVAYFRRRPLIQGITGGRKPDEFVQFALTHNTRLDHQSAWTQTEYIFRERIRGGQTFGLVHEERYDLDDGAWSLFVNGSAYLQRVLFTGVNDTQWSADARARLVRPYELGPRTTNFPQVTVFARAINLPYNPYPAGIIDQDIFTTFKRDQRTGIILADTLSYQPWLDTQWWIHPALMTNNDYNVFKPDNLSVTFGWQQWIRPVGFDLSYRITDFYQDADRSQTRTQQLVTLEAFTEGWVYGKIRCDSSVYFQHNFFNHNNSLSAMMTLTWDAGFNAWHHRPGEADFQTLRKWRGAEPRGPGPLDWW